MPYNAAYQKAWRLKYRDRINAQRRARYAADPDKYKALTDAWRKASPDRYTLTNRARQRVAYAIQKGTLTRPALCSLCHAPGLIEAAHLDYSRPLDVIWLCRPCHRTIDQKDPKTRI